MPVRMAPPAVTSTSHARCPGRAGACDGPAMDRAPRPSAAATACARRSARGSHAATRWSRRARRGGRAGDRRRPNRGHRDRRGAVAPMIATRNSGTAGEGDRPGRPGVRAAQGPRARRQHEPRAAPPAATAALGFGPAGRARSGLDVRRGR